MEGYCRYCGYDCRYWGYRGYKRYWGTQVELGAVARKVEGSCSIRLFKGKLIPHLHLEVRPAWRANWVDRCGVQRKKAEVVGSVGIWEGQRGSEGSKPLQ